MSYQLNKNKVDQRLIDWCDKEEQTPSCWPANAHIIFEENGVPHDSNSTLRKITSLWPNFITWHGTGWSGETYALQGGVTTFMIASISQLEGVKFIYSLLGCRWNCNCRRLKAMQVTYADGLDLRGCPALTHLPDGLSVGGTLYLDDCSMLTHLPERMSVGGSLQLTGCSALTHLPEGLSVRSNLNLTDCSALTHLPEGLSVKGNLDLTGCSALTHLPKGLSVAGSLWLTDCTMLTKLPADLRVRGAIDLRRCTALLRTFRIDRLKHINGRVMIATDSRHRPHCEDGPAYYVFRQPHYFWHGVEVPDYVIEQPDTITATNIMSETNAEVRRVMMERFGIEKCLQKLNARKVSEDDFGVLWRLDIPGSARPIMIVKVVNCSPEPDGSYKDYLLRVPHNMTSAKQAVAWTFGLKEDEYIPMIQT